MDFLELMREFKNVSTICESDIAEDIVRVLFDEDVEFLEETIESVYNMLHENKFIILSKLEDEYIIEPFIRENGKQYLLENDNILIQDELFNIVDFEKIEGEIAKLTIEDDEDEEVCDCYLNGYEQGYLDAIELMKKML